MPTSGNLGPGVTWSFLNAGKTKLKVKKAARAVPWTSFLFPDAAWQSGKAPLGVDDGSIQWATPLAPNGNIKSGVAYYYFRRVCASVRGCRGLPWGWA